jgi:hypothetical protein
MDRLIRACSLIDHRSTLLSERKERNALEIQLQPQLVKSRQPHEVAKLADELQHLDAESQKLTKIITSKEQQHDATLLRRR